jgi:predicted metalloprotease with PDZ domain
MDRVAWLFLLGLGGVAAPAAAQQPSLRYTVDLNRRADDLFRVTLSVKGLTPDNAVYQFASTAPGTYEVMDIGRYVRSFEARDAQGEAVPTERVSVNQWRLADAPRVRTIQYTIAETWDTEVQNHPIYLMCGSSLERDNVLINPHAIIGYPTGLQADSIHLRLVYPAGWKIGTALRRAGKQEYVAESYDQLVDSPIMLGRLSQARVMVTGVPVEIYAYSKRDPARATHLRGAMNAMLQAAGRFLGKLPVDHYTFLYHFEDSSAGAWEHSYSSEYVLQDGRFTDSVAQRVRDIAAHEFFHVVTPLNIHSEIIEHFNFVTPVASQHLWLYEGTTEWAAHMMQLRAGIKTPEAYLNTILQKIRIDRSKFNTAYSLRQLSLTSYSDSGQKQYGNIYMRGALVAGLLDIRLLELSHGRRGLEDLIQELTRKYGKHRAFPEGTLVDTLVAMTYPEIGDFFNRYVFHAEPLPIKEYYGKLGIRLVEDPEGTPEKFVIASNPLPNQRLLREAWLGRKPSGAI